MAGALAHTLATSPQCWAQNAAPAQPGTPGAAHDIVMTAHVAPSCRMTDVGQQIILTGTTDAGETINTSVSGQGGFVVDCNTPYAMGLQRTTVYSAPAGNTGARASNDRGPNGTPELKVAESTNGRAMRDGGGVAFGAERPDDVARQDARDLEVVVRVAGVDGQIESRCIMAEAVTSGFVCHALAGPDDVRQPLPRTKASMVVTGSVAPDTYHALETPALPTTDAAVLTAVSSATDTAERAIVEKAIKTTGRVRTGDRLTVSLSARY